MVSNLIEESTCSWKYELVHNMFKPESAAAILRIELPLARLSDVPL